MPPTQRALLVFAALASSFTFAACNSSRDDRPPITLGDAGPPATGDGGTPRPDTDGGLSILEPDEPPVNLSYLHYASRVRRERVEHPPEEAPELTTTRGTTTMPRGIALEPAWSSSLGRRALEGTLRINRSALLEGDDPEISYSEGLCTTPDFTSNGHRTLPNGYVIRGATATFATDYDAFTFLKTVKARMPFFLPFRHPDVSLAQGWYYNSGGGHGAQDYSRGNVPDGEDATFGVYASGAGVVVGVFWRDSWGNTIVVEHTAPTGERYLTLYLHMRDGRDHDVAKARAIDCSGVSDDRCPLYKTFADDYSTHVSWGTNSHQIAVSQGDTVHAGQFLGYAGNTGYGGAGWGLNADGSPASSRGNVHLHTYWAAAHPTNDGEWVFVDPYGVYAQASTGCYDLLKDTEFDRLIAPYYPAFHGVPIEVLYFYFGYYPQMGMSPRTISVHREGGKLLVSGAFERGIEGGWFHQAYLTGAEWQIAFETYAGVGFLPRETTVTTSSTGEARYSGIWRAVRPGEGAVHLAAMSDVDFDSSWDSMVVGDGWRIEDYFRYQVSGTWLTSALFTSDAPRPFYLHPSLTAAELSATLAEAEADGLAPVSINAYVTPSGPRYAVILRDEPGCWSVGVDLTADGYQQTATSKFADGYRLHKIQGYPTPSGTRWAAVFAITGPSAPAVCP